MRRDMALALIVAFVGCRSTPDGPARSGSSSIDVAAVTASATAPPAPPSAEPPRPPSAQETVFAGLVADIVALKVECPQLADFDPNHHAMSDRLTISYGFHTHRSTVPGGWRSGFPEPDPDGVALYIDIHSKNSRSQLHTQPAGLPTWDVGGDLLLFIMFEGEKTTSCSPKVEEAIIKRLGPQRRAF